MARRGVEEPKVRALRDSGTLYGRADEVRDELFRPGAFFDPRDLVQVKYEMLRRVDAEGASVTEAAAAFGLSRAAFYEARRRMEGEGLAGLRVSRGMAAWMRAWVELLPSRDEAPREASDPSRVPPMAGRGEIVTILAHMALDAR